MLKTNFNFLEAIFFGKIVMNKDPEAVQEIRSVLNENLPADIHYHYRGMAKQNYHTSLRPEKDTYDPSPKKYLYVLRGLLAAEYVQEHEQLEPDIKKLSGKLLESEKQDIIADLVAAKRERLKKPSEELQEKAEDLIQGYLKKEEKEAEKDREKLRSQIDSWMMDLRKKYSKD